MPGECATSCPNHRICDLFSWYTTWSAEINVSKEVSVDDSSPMTVAKLLRALLINYKNH